MSVADMLLHRVLAGAAGGGRMKCPICDNEILDSEARPDITNKAVREAIRVSPNFTEAGRLLGVSREEVRLLKRIAFAPDEVERC